MPNSKISKRQSVNPMINVMLTTDTSRIQSMIRVSVPIIVPYDRLQLRDFQTFNKKARNESHGLMSCSGETATDFCLEQGNFRAKAYKCKNNSLLWLHDPLQMETAHLVSRTQFTKHLTEVWTAFLMPEKPRLRMEINNISSLVTLFISLFFLSLLTVNHNINVLRDDPHTFGGLIGDVYIFQTTCKTSCVCKQTENKCFFQSDLPKANDIYSR